jgi:hypothetical protein
VKEPVERSGWAARSEEVEVLEDALRICCCCCIVGMPSFCYPLCKGEEVRSEGGVRSYVGEEEKLDVNVDQGIAWSGLS